MGIFKNILGKAEKPIKSYDDFWVWFQNNEKEFYKVIKHQGNIERDIFDKLSSKLNQLKDGYFFLVGMFDNETAELVLTADGVYKNIVFVEELVQSAPKLDNWRFTATKPSLNVDDVYIRMGDLEFNKENLSFYAYDHPNFPDEIDITIVHVDYTEELIAPITNGVYLFLDNYLGELKSITTIDRIKIIGQNEVEKELIPIEKLKDYLNWRQKEFIEKYEGTRYNMENDSYNTLEATLDNGKPILAVVNSAVLDWDRKASHPWILTVAVKFKGNENGMPDKETFELLNTLEDNLMFELKDSEGYLNVGRQTAESSREIYFACKDFRRPSKVLFKIQMDYKNSLNINYDFYKDKYWRSFDRFKPGI